MVITHFVRLAVVGSLALLVVDVNAQSIDEARAAFEEGRFLEAADIAEALQTSDGYALAAQSLAVFGRYLASEENRTRILQRAMDFGEAAVQADSTNPETHYQAAHAAGRYAQNLGKMTAMKKGMAQKTLRLLEAALAVKPDFAEAHMALGGWHADIASAGPLARMIYGGNRKSAIKHFERAMELEPNSIYILYQYAIRLPELDGDSGRDRAWKLLAKAAQLPVGNAYEELIHQDVLEAMDAFNGDP